MRQCILYHFIKTAANKKYEIFFTHIYSTCPCIRYLAKSRLPKSIIDNLSRPYRRCIAILMWISYIAAAYFLISELILYWNEHGFNWRVAIKILVSAGWITILYRSITLKNTLAKKLWK